MGPGWFCQKKTHRGQGKKRTVEMTGGGSVEKRTIRFAGAVQRKESEKEGRSKKTTGTRAAIFLLKGERCIDNLSDHPWSTGKGEKERKKLVRHKGEVRLMGGGKKWGSGRIIY